jgi:glycosyltransferase involved in cell wall biosynthesis
LASQNNKIHIFYVDTGYKYDMDVTYGPKLGMLSQRFRGRVLTDGEPGFHNFGGIEVESLPLMKSKALRVLRTLRFAHRYIRSKRIIGDPVQLIVSYDALTTGLIGRLLNRWFGIPQIVEVNGDYTNWSNYADIPNPTKRRMKRALYIRIERFVLRRAGGIKLLYSRQLDFFSRSLPAKTFSRVFPNFLDLSAFTNLGEDKKIVIVGFPFIVKGIDLAIAAFRKVAPEFPEWNLEVLGWYRGEEKALLDGCIGDHPQIRHVAQIYKRDMPAYLGRAGIVLCASRTEGFPRVIKEAMQAAKPCVVSNVGGMPDAIEHEVNGLIFRSEDVDDLAAVLGKMLVDPSLRQRLGQRAAEYAHQHYTTQAYVDNLGDFAAEVIARAEPAK